MNYSYRGCVAQGIQRPSINPRKNDCSFFEILSINMLYFPSTLQILIIVNLSCNQFKKKLKIKIPIQHQKEMIRWPGLRYPLYSYLQKVQNLQGTYNFKPGFAEKLCFNFHAETSFFITSAIIWYRIFTKTCKFFTALHASCTLYTELTGWCSACHSAESLFYVYEYYSLGSPSNINNNNKII